MTHVLNVRFSSFLVVRLSRSFLFSSRLDTWRMAAKRRIFSIWKEVNCARELWVCNRKQIIHFCFYIFPYFALFVVFMLDHVDIVQDQISASDYNREEDPKLFVSTKTGRGPLNDNWIAEYSAGITTPPPSLLIPPLTVLLFSTDFLKEFSMFSFCHTYLFF